MTGIALRARRWRSWCAVSALCSSRSQNDGCGPPSGCGGNAEPLAARIDADLLGRQLTGSSIPGWSCPCSGRSRSASPPSCRARAWRSPSPPRSGSGGCDPRPRPRASDAAADRLHHLAERLEAVPADERVAVRQRRHHAARRTENSPALTRGLTHTIRCARRARRSIWRPTSCGSPRSQPSERITTTAPRAMPRRPWRSLNAFSASPMRVPLDQSGAVAAARCIARSGCRVPAGRA